MEKAYDRVWKDGLRLKLQKSGVTGCMYQWISQYLINRKARVHLNGTYSRKKTLKGVPQGGVLSRTLFLVFINDIVGDTPRKVQGAIYADDLVLWCSEEHLSTPNYRLQEALNTLEGWTKRWLVRINPKKTTYTIFSLSTKGTEGNPAYQRPDSACWGQPHLPGGDFRQAADLETTNRKSWSQSQGATCPHEEVGRHDMGSRYCDSQETVHW